MSSRNAGPSKGKAAATSSTPIPPPTTQLPLARVNRIIKADRDVRMCTKEAIFLIARATEYMIHKMVNQAHENARLNAGPGKGGAKKITYQDLAAVTARPEWFYLAEVIPPTVTLSAALSYRAHNGVGGLIDVTDEAHPAHPSSASLLEGGNSAQIKKQSRKSRGSEVIGGGGGVGGGGGGASGNGALESQYIGDYVPPGRERGRGEEDGSEDGMDVDR